LSRPKTNTIYAKTLNLRVKSMLDDLYSGKVDEIRVSYTRSGNSGMTPMYMVWTVNPNPNSGDYMQRFLCKCFDKSKPNVMLFDFE